MLRVAQVGSGACNLLGCLSLKVTTYSIPYYSCPNFANGAKLNEGKKSIQDSMCLMPGRSEQRASRVKKVIAKHTEAAREPSPSTALRDAGFGLCQAAFWLGFLWDFIYTSIQSSRGPQSDLCTQDKLKL